MVVQWPETGDKAPRFETPEFQISNRYLKTIKINRTTELSPPSEIFFQVQKLKISVERKEDIFDIFAQSIDCGTR